LEYLWRSTEWITQSRSISDRVIITCRLDLFRILSSFNIQPCVLLKRHLLAPKESKQETQICHLGLRRQPLQHEPLAGTVLVHDSNGINCRHCMRVPHCRPSASTSLLVYVEVIFLAWRKYVTQLGHTLRTRVKNKQVT
jgi:hypothetical protein